MKPKQILFTDTEVKNFISNFKCCSYYIREMVQCMDISDEKRGMYMRSLDLIAKYTDTIDNDEEKFNKHFKEKKYREIQEEKERKRRNRN